MHNIETMFSSKSDEWATPQAIFEELDKEFHFDLDAAASDDNHKCDRYFTLENNGLSQNWGGAEYFAIHPIARLINGLKRHLERLETIIHLLPC